MACTVLLIFETSLHGCHCGLLGATLYAGKVAGNAINTRDYFAKHASLIFQTREIALLTRKDWVFTSSFSRNRSGKCFVSRPRIARPTRRDGHNYPTRQKSPAYGDGVSAPMKSVSSACQTAARRTYISRLQQAIERVHSSPIQGPHKVLRRK